MLLLRSFPTLTAIAICSVVQLASALAQTKITIGVAAMSPRTIPLLLAQEQGLFAKQKIDARLIRKLDENGYIDKAAAGYGLK